MRRPSAAGIREERATMGVLQRFERGLSGGVEGVFARLFHGRVEPVEIAAALNREADLNKAVGPSRVLVPNVYEVELSEADYSRLAPYAVTLADELADLVTEHAAEQGYSFVGPVTVDLLDHPGRSTGSLRVSSRVEADDAPPADDAVSWRRPAQVVGPLDDRPAPAPAAPSHPRPAAPADWGPPPMATPPQAVPGPATEAWPPPGPEWQPRPASRADVQYTEMLPRPRTYGQLELPDGTHRTIEQRGLVLGRGSEADVQLGDSAVSRRHARILVDGEAVVLQDLGSTNGTSVDGQRVTDRVVLRSGARVTLGGSTVVFRG